MTVTVTVTVIVIVIVTVIVTVFRDLKKRLARIPWALLAVAAASLYAASYVAYLLVGAQKYADSRAALLANAAGIVFSVYAAAAGAFQILFRRREISRALRAAAVRPAFYRLLAYLFVGSLVLGLTLGQGVERPKEVFRAALALSLLVLFGALVFRERVGRLAASPWVRRLDLALANVLVAAVLLEAGLHAVAFFSPSPLFMRFESDNKIERVRRPMEDRMGFPQNASGFYDEEFRVEKDEGTFRIVALGDSFAAGIVPYPYNVFTLAEEGLSAAASALPAGLTKVEIYNMGVNGIDAADYRYLFLTEGMDYRPDAVLILFYLANDWGGGATPSFLDPNFWYLYFIPARLLALREEASRRGVDVSEVGAEKKAEFWEDPAAISDWRKEEPSYSPERYMEIERNWLKYFGAKDGARRRRERETFAALADIFRAVRSLPGGRAAVAAAPAEFQVDDEHYREVLKFHGFSAADFDLDLPGRRLEEFCREEEVPYLDLTPALREGHRELGRVYWLRDMHWNANGNRVAAEALAEFLREEVVREER
ncbi:MAG: SGNH/GDSL hydrolase family protein [Planctomycetes bacterium]|nr:SGNH/GDSL hydrolase family protein [Planctomycetota bacterium]